MVQYYKGRNPKSVVIGLQRGTYTRIAFYEKEILSRLVRFESSNPSIKNENPSFSYPLDRKKHLRKQVLFSTKSTLSGG